MMLFKINFGFSFFLILVVLHSCCSSLKEDKQDQNLNTQHVDLSTIPFRTNFTKEEDTIIKVGRSIIENTYFGTLITVDNIGQPRARVVEPFAPDSAFILWIATNPKSRKVNQIKENPLATFHFFDQKEIGYVSLMGQVFIVNDNEVKATKWKDGFEKYYKNKTDDYLLIKFIPKTLELISIPNGLTGDTLTWQPHKVILR